MDITNVRRDLYMPTLQTQDVYSETWVENIKSSAIVKDDLFKENFQYPLIGLSGLSMLAGLDGLGMSAPNAPYAPEIFYEYWWNDKSCRVDPFILDGNYETDSITGKGELINYHQDLDLISGILTTTLQVRSGSQVWNSIRTSFITPEGVLVWRIKDEGPAHLFLLKVLPQTVNHGYTAEYRSIGNGMLSIGKAKDSCTATISVLCEDTTMMIEEERGLLTVSQGDHRESVFYFAAGSSYESVDAASTAINRVHNALTEGFQICMQHTQEWWARFWNKSQVLIPVNGLEQWYIRSLYYNGVIFGNSHVPPGCFGPRHEGYSGCVCPEYDLILSHYALLLSNHSDVAASIADWIERVLTRTKQVAREIENGYFKRGAKYGWLMSYDGSITTEYRPEREGWEHFPGIMAALIVLNQVEYTSDLSRLPRAKEVLLETTMLAADQLIWDDECGGYIDKKNYGYFPKTAALRGGDDPEWVERRGAAKNTSGARAGMEMCVKLGIDEPTWKEMAEKSVLPTWIHPKTGKEVLVGGFDQDSRTHFDTINLLPVWPFRNLLPASDLVQNSYKAYNSNYYTFCAGWWAIIGAMIGDSESAYDNLLDLLRPEVIADDMYYTELAGAKSLTPEIAAHGVLVSAINSMLVECPNNDQIRVFPVMPEAWVCGVSFQDLLSWGNIHLSGSYSNFCTEVIIKNRNNFTVVKKVRIRVAPEIVTLYSGKMEIRKYGDGQFICSDIILEPEQSKHLIFNSQED